jgi:hypothetical protein
MATHDGFQFPLPHIAKSRIVSERLIMFADGRDERDG